MKLNGKVPRVVVDPGMRRSLLHGNREIFIAANPSP